jgi:hypothetical protein
MRVHPFPSLRFRWYTKLIISSVAPEVVMQHKNPIRLPARKTLMPLLAAVLALALASTGAMMASGAPRAAAPQAVPVAVRAAAATPVPLPLTGTLTDSAGKVVGNVTGQVSSFVIRNNRLTALANLTGTSGAATQSVRGVALPISDATNPRAISGVVNCQILNLIIRPIDLNLLGLKVHLNKVLLNITAVAGSGNLLGNLLCAVAHLLDGPPPFLTNARALLNQALIIIGKLQNP